MRYSSQARVVDGQEEKRGTRLSHENIAKNSHSGVSCDLKPMSKLESRNHSTYEHLEEEISGSMKCSGIEGQ